MSILASISFSAVVSFFDCILSFRNIILAVHGSIASSSIMLSGIFSSCQSVLYSLSRSANCSRTICLVTSVMFGSVIVGFGWHAAMLIISNNSIIFFISLSFLLCLLNFMKSES